MGKKLGLQILVFMSFGLTANPGQKNPGMYLYMEKESREIFMNSVTWKRGSQLQNREHPKWGPVKDTKGALDLEFWLKKDTNETEAFSFRAIQ